MVRNSWFKSYRGNSSLGTLVRQDIFDKGQNALIDYLLEHFPPIVATLEDVPDEIIGWACREFARPVTHYVYVKYDYRRHGIGSMLVNGTQQHSHRTRAGEFLFKKHGSVFNPYLITTPCPLSN